MKGHSTETQIRHGERHIKFKTDNIVIKKRLPRCKKRETVCLYLTQKCRFE